MTESQITSTVAKTEDKTIQITFTFPFSFIKKTQDEVVEEYAKEAEIPGFRKGKAPLEKVKEKIPQNVLLEKSLAKILPKALAKAINENKIRPAIYPKFELLKAKEGEDWQIRATTCELPMVKLGNYKEVISGLAKAKTIWTPDKGKTEDKPKEASREEKEQQVIKALLDTIKVEVPKILADEEVDTRLASLLDRLEKLGLNLESYLNSLGKTPQSLRLEYELQSKNTIILELILNAIAEQEKIIVEESQVDEAIKAASTDPRLAEKLKAPEQRKLIRSVLARRATLDYLASVV